MLVDWLVVQHFDHVDLDVKLIFSLLVFCYIAKQPGILAIFTTKQAMASTEGIVAWKVLIYEVLINILWCSASMVNDESVRIVLCNVISLILALRAYCFCISEYKGSIEQMFNWHLFGIATSKSANVIHAY